MFFSINSTARLNACSFLCTVALIKSENDISRIKRILPKIVYGYVIMNSHQKTFSRSFSSSCRRRKKFYLIPANTFPFQKQHAVQRHTIYQNAKKLMAKHPPKVGIITTFINYNRFHNINY